MLESLTMARRNKFKEIFNSKENFKRIRERGQKISLSSHHVEGPLLSHENVCLWCLLI
jgi:hypothetical protein